MLREKMEFDKEIFNKYYGKIYFNSLRYSFYVFIISVAVFIVLQIDGMQSFIQVKQTIGIGIGLYIVPIGPLIFSVYITKKKKAKLQKQYISSNKLYVEICVEEGVTGIVYNSLWIRYVVNSIDDIHISRRYIIIDGTIDKETVDKGYGHSKKISRIKIPRVFEKEEQIISLHRGF